MMVRSPPSSGSKWKSTVGRAVSTLPTSACSVAVFPPLSVMMKSYVPLTLTVKSAVSPSTTVPSGIVMDLTPLGA